MGFQPITNYTGYNHVLFAGANWTHPGNGNTYCCACEQLSGIRQNLSVYRMRPGTSAWEHVETFEGTVDSVAQITMGGASIELDGTLLVETSLTIKDAPKVTNTGFQGCWIRLPGIDDPYELQSVLLARIAALEARVAALPPTTTGPVIRIPASGPVEGGEIQLADGAGGPPWCIDVYAGVLRLHRAGKVVAQWVG